MSNLPIPPLTIEAIEQALHGPLPGVNGQLKMAPERADSQVNRWGMADGYREAGVLLLLYYLDTDAQLDLHLVLTRRTEYPGVHSGQISLPGGRRETGETLQTTALREAEEEIGVSPEMLTVLGRLSSLYTPPSNFCIFPFVAFCPTRPHFRLEPKEVAEVIETPLSLLRHPQTRREEMWHFDHHGERRVPYFDVFGHKVWGATAMILSEFLALLNDNLTGL